MVELHESVIEHANSKVLRLATELILYYLSCCHVSLDLLLG